jgi:hypothetical protein
MHVVVGHINSYEWSACAPKIDCAGAKAVNARRFDPASANFAQHLIIKRNDCVCVCELLLRSCQRCHHIQ